MRHGRTAEVASPHAAQSTPRINARHLINMKVSVNKLLSRTAIDRNLRRIGRQRAPGKKLVGVSYDARARLWSFLGAKGPRVIAREWSREVRNRLLATAGKHLRERSLTFNATAESPPRRPW